MNKTINLELSVNHINTILHALGEIPAKISMETILEIQRQESLATMKAQINERNDDKSSVSD